MGVVDVKHVNSKSEAEILALTTDDDKWYDQGFYYPNDKPVKRYFYRAIDGVMEIYPNTPASIDYLGVNLNGSVIGGAKTFIEEDEILNVPLHYEMNTSRLIVDGVVNIEGVINIL